LHGYPRFLTYKPEQFSHFFPSRLSGKRPFISIVPMFFAIRRQPAQSFFEIVIAFILPIGVARKKEFL
jgi:hypothetical protein